MVRPGLSWVVVVWLRDRSDDRRMGQTHDVDDRYRDEDEHFLPLVDVVALLLRGLVEYSLAPALLSASTVVVDSTLDRVRPPMHSVA